MKRSNRISLHRHEITKYKIKRCLTRSTFSMKYFKIDAKGDLGYAVPNVRQGKVVNILSDMLNFSTRWAIR